MHEECDTGRTTCQQARVPVHADPERNEQRRRDKGLHVLEERVPGRRLGGMKHGAAV